MKFLSLEQLVALNSLAIQHGGGSSGVRDIVRLESAVATQSQSVFGEELYQDIFEKAAVIIRGIVQDHPFIDGNKRTAMLAGLTLLDLNGVKLNFEEGEVEDFAVKIAVENLSVKQIAAWLESHSEAE